MRFRKVFRLSSLIKCFDKVQSLVSFLVPVVGLLEHFLLLLGPSRLAFGHFWVAPGPSWAAPGGLLAALGPILADLGRS